MKRAAAAIALSAVLSLSACGQNPLLKSVSADFAPIRVGSQWSYVNANGAAALERHVSGAGSVFGRDAFSVVTQVGVAAPSTEYWSLNVGALERHDPVLGWTLMRRLPYVFSNKWDLATGNAPVSAVQSVEGLESVTTPAGKFDNCYRLKTKTSTFDAVNDVTNTVESLVWAAPNVGDVRYADVDSSGNVQVTLALSSYRIP